MFDQNEYIKSYNKANYSKITLAVKPEEKEKWKSYADANGISLTELARRAAEQYMHNHPIEK